MLPQNYGRLLFLTEFDGLPGPAEAAKEEDSARSGKAGDTLPARHGLLFGAAGIFRAPVGERLLFVLFAKMAE
jgi:hypothetical protein